MKSCQHGASLIGMVLLTFLLGVAVLVGFKIVGPYREYFALQRIVGLVADEGNNGASESEMRKSYDRLALIDSIETVKPKDLVFSKSGDRLVVEVEYSRKVPLFRHISLFFDFKASSQNSRK